MFESINFISVDITSSQVNNLDTSKPRCHKESIPLFSPLSVQSKSNATAILACTAASKAAISTKPAPRFKHFFHLLPKSDGKKPLHMTQVSNDDDSSKGTAVHTSKKNFCSHFQFPIYKIQF